MSTREPDEPERREPRDVDAAFAEIVANWDAEPQVPAPDDYPHEARAASEQPRRNEVRPDSAPQDSVSQDSVSQDSVSQDSVSQDSVSQSGGAGDSAGRDGIGQEVSGPEDDDHYIPPEPPPLPRLRPRTFVGLGLLLIGAVLVIAPGLVGLGQSLATPLGLVALTAGLCWLVLGIRPGPPPDSGWDDGARV